MASAAGFAQNQGNQGQPQEFEPSEAMFQQWDTNGDGQLSQQEFIQGARNVGLFNKWDGNNDGRIDQNEFDELGFEGEFASWDQNNTGYLDPNELYTGVFQSNDQNQDGQWSMEDWNSFAGGRWFDW